MARRLVAILVVLAMGGCVPIGFKGSSRYAGSPPDAAFAVAPAAERN